MTEWTIVRHGETDWNVAHRFQGHVDIPLNARGRLQAERLAQRLADEHFDAVYCSDLARTRETLAPLAARLGVAPVADSALREQAFGVLEGLDLAEILARHADVWDDWRRHDADYAPPGGGESNRTFHARVNDAFVRIGRAHPHERVLVVCHGGVLDMLWRSVNALPLHGARDCTIPNAGLNRLRSRGDRFEIIDWADDAHVADLGGVHPVRLSETA